MSDSDTFFDKPVSGLGILIGVAIGVTITYIFMRKNQATPIQTTSII